MKYLALFENWQEPFTTRYDKAIKLFNLGLADSPLSPNSQVWEDFKQIVADKLEENGYQVEELFTMSENRATLEISYTRQLEHGPTDTKYLRFMIMWKSDDSSVVYLVGPDYLKELSLQDPIYPVTEILRIADKYLKPEA